MKHLKVGSKVFAKRRGFPEWPGKIARRVDGDHYSVEFYPECETAVVNGKFIRPFFKFLHKFAKIKNKKFHDALAVVFTKMNTHELRLVRDNDVNNLFSSYYCHLKDKGSSLKPQVNKRSRSVDKKQQNEVENAIDENLEGQNELLNAIAQSAVVQNPIDPVKERCELLDAIAKGLKAALPLHQPPNTEFCLRALGELQRLNLSKSDLNNCSFIVPVIDLIRHYQASPIIGSTQQRNLELSIQSRIIREKAEEVYKVIKLYLPKIYTESQLIEYEKYILRLKSVSESC